MVVSRIWNFLSLYYYTILLLFIYTYILTTLLYCYKSILYKGSKLLFLVLYLTTLLFFCLNTPVQHNFVPDLYRICTGFAPVLHRICSKIEKNMAIFCNFFSLCINKLEEIWKNNCTKHLTIFENVVSLHRR